MAYDEMTREESIAALRQSGPMDGHEMTACLALMAWSKQTMSRELDIDEGTVRQWGRGSRPVPAPIAAWLRAIAGVHAAHPPPARPLRPME